MKRVLSILSVSVLLWSCQDNNKIEVGNKTKIEVQSVVEMGDVMLGENVNASFEVKNVGDYPLILAEVKGSCSCTVAEYKKDPIAPGESVTIKATVKTDNVQPGLLRKDVRIVSNTDPSITSVLITANVLRK